MVPKYLIRYWAKETRTLGKPATLKHTVLYNEDELLPELRKIHGNYTVYEVGGTFKNKEYFDEIFKKETESKDREELNRLKKKFGEE